MRTVRKLPEPEDVCCCGVESEAARETLRLNTLEYTVRNGGLEL